VQSSFETEVVWRTKYFCFYRFTGKVLLLEFFCWVVLLAFFWVGNDQYILVFPRLSLKDQALEEINHWKHMSHWQITIWLCLLKAGKWYISLFLKWQCVESNYNIVHTQLHRDIILTLQRPLSWLDMLPSCCPIRKAEDMLQVKHALFCEVLTSEGKPFEG